MATGSKVQPAFRAPPLSCDTHFHIFGPPDRYPVHSRARYECPLALLDDYLEFAGGLGIERLVFVQPSAYGTDNSCMLDGMAAFGPGARGIVDISEDCPDRLIEDLHERGVRGVRINTSPIAPYDPGRLEALAPRIDKLASRLAGLGWCLEFLGPGWLTEALIPTMRALPTEFVIDHMGVFPAEKGIDQPGFRALLRLTETGRCWVKLTGVYRMSQAPDFADAAPFAQSLSKAAPDRLLWGSDHPHLSFEHVDSVTLFNLLGEWFPDEGLRCKILVENPERLFDFGKQEAGRTTAETVALSTGDKSGGGV